MMPWASASSGRWTRALRAPARRIAAALLAAGALAATAPARADTPIGLFKTFSGNVNFAGTQVTIRDRASGANPCTVSAETVSQSATLTMPANATVLSAQLYWAGSGTADTSVNMNGRPVAGGTGRTYTSPTIGGGFDYFSVAADVTQQVKAKGAGTYTFSGLRVSTGSPWCGRSAVVGGYAMVVVYSSPDEIYRTLNLYEGFVALLNSEQRVDMSNFRVPPNITSSAVGRFGHLVWEGDMDIAQEGESLTFHNLALNHSTYAPSGNNFNSKSSINSDSTSMGIDYDSYSLTGWPAGLSTVSALFRTGGDMVLLNAAVLAVPSSPSADLTVDLVRNTELRGGSIATYTATVTNLGPGTEPGPTKVNLTLPAGLSYSSFSGTNWNCTGSGTTATCTYTGALSSGAQAPALILKALVASTASGSKTTTVAVVGNNDPGSTNNQDSDTSTVVAGGGISFEYTARQCNAGELVGNGGTCPLYAGPLYAGATATIWLTAVDSSNRARTPDANYSTTIALDLALGCVNPTSTGGVRASYGGIALPTCVRDTAVAASTSVWTRVNATFAAGQISMGINFQYMDVGAVKLYVRTTSGAIDFVQFVSMPRRLGLTITNAEGKTNPGASAALGSGLAQNGFVRAGEKFKLEVKALSIQFTDSSGSYRYVLPNFGKEEGKLARPAFTTTVTRLDAPKAGATATTAALEGQFPLTGPFVSSDFSWSDIGNMTLRMVLDEYLGEEPAADGQQDVGRFYPAYFSTAVTHKDDPTQLAGFSCLPRMNCPIVGLAAVNGAIYSGQPFWVRTSAHDENGRKLTNFDTAIFPTLVPALTLAAVDAPGTGTSFAGRIAPGLADTAGSAGVASNATGRAATFGLGARYSPTVRASAIGPTAVYLRATAPENRMGTALTLSSVQSDVAESEEGGIMVVNGRLSVASVIASELLRTPILLQAQYWNGKNWEVNTKFDNTTLGTANAIFSNCVSRNTLCTGDALKPAAAGPLPISGGSARYMLAPAGAGKSGSARLRFEHPDLGWLPSMFGQITIGTFKSPVIYMREVY